MSQKLALRLFGALTFFGLVAVALWPTTERPLEEAAERRATVGTSAVEVNVVADEQAMAPLSQTFVVYFSFDSDALSANARETLAAAMQFAEGLDGAQIDVAGHTDRAGPQDYNEILAERRAAAVAAEVVGGGLALAALQVRQFGETQPSVVTDDGVEHARNRRVEITISA